MDPRTLFPLLAVGFLALAAWRGWRTRRWRGAVATWTLMGLIFGAVALWLRIAA